MNADANCGACGRAMTPGRVSCIVCGWEPGHAERTYGAEVPEAEYVQGATLMRFLLASLVLAPLGLSLVRDALAAGDAGLGAIGGVCLLLGPVVAALQGWRRGRARVSTGAQGLTLGGELIPWAQIEGIELEGARGMGPGLGAVSGASRSRVLRLAAGGRGPLGILLAPVMLIFTLVLPAVRLLSPWHPVVVLRRSRGDRVRLHDLADEAGFHAVVRARLDVAHLAAAA